jgi:hypothetical protein
MRTTITFDPDVAAKLKQSMRKHGRGFKETVNALIRRGLRDEEKDTDRPPFKVKPFLHSKPGVNYDNIGDVLEQLEGPDYK